LNGSPWSLVFESFDAESGVSRVFTAQAGGLLGTVGNDYAVDGAYPQGISMQIDWAHGATFDLHNLTFEQGAAPPPGIVAAPTPAGAVDVRGTITCG
jgi:hypothetical protein